jgi:hypothetical protein
LSADAVPELTVASNTSLKLPAKVFAFAAEIEPSDTFKVPDPTPL